MHPWSIEVYQILEGSGTLVTGGLLVLPLAESNNPNVIRSQNGIDGGQARQVSAGIFNVYALAVDGSGETQLTHSTGDATLAVSYLCR